MDTNGGHKMRIFTSDWHLHPFRSYSTITEGGLNSRLAEQVSAIMGIIKWGGDHGASHMIHAGDVFHAQGEHLSKDVLRAAYILFEKAAAAGMKNIIIPGNHDFFKGGKTIFRPFQDVAEIITKPTSRRIDDEVFTFIPYQRSYKKFVEYLAAESEKIDWKTDRARFLVCHEIFEGTKVGPSQYQLKLMQQAFPSKPIVGYDYVIAGHCHKAQIVGTNIYSPGSPLQHDHGDQGDDRGFLTWDGESMTFMPVASPKFHTITITNLDEYRAFIENYIEGDYYRIVMDGNLEIELPRSRKIEVMKKGRAEVKERIATKHKQTEEIIEEAVAKYNSDLDKREILDTVLKLWEESENESA